MRLTGASEDQALAEVWAYLTLTELRDLFEALRSLLEQDDDAPGWHHHLGEPGRAELTLAKEA